MARLLVLLPFVLVVLLVAAIVDLLMIEPGRVRALPKLAWALIVIVVPVIGPILWFAFGRERRGRANAVRRPLAPDDDPAFLASVRRQSDERIRRLEQELADPDDDPPGGKTKPE